MSLQRKNLARLAGNRDIRSEALSILEGLRQEQIAPDVSPAEIERNRRLVQGTIDITPVAPYNTALGAEVQGLGIDGAFKPDSTVRLHTQYANTGDTVLLPEVAGYGIQPLGIATEYLSPATEAALLQASGKAPAAFNRVLGEYYGQQALKLAGNTPVPDAERSTNVVNSPNHPNSTLGTDRLIETQRSVMGQDVGPAAGDYRYLDNDGYLHVGDYQVATHKPGNRDIPIKLQLAKESSLSPANTRRFAGELQKAAQGRKSIDTALGLLLDAGVLPQLVQRSYKFDGTPPKSGYTRAGKVTSDGNRMGALNVPIETGGQHRYDNILFGIKGQKALGQIGGGVPDAYYQVDTQAARNFLAAVANEGGLTKGPSAINIGADGSIYTNTPLSDLERAGVAVNLLNQAPSVHQLL